MHPIRSSIRRLGFDLPSRSHRICQLLQHFDRAVPVHTRIRDADSRLQRCQTAAISWRRLLVAFVDIRLDHDADNAFFARSQLVTDDLRDLRLVLVVLLRVACATAR